MLVLGVTLLLLLMLPAPHPARAQGPITLTDMAGRRVTLKGPARHIIPTFKPVTLCMLSLGLQDRLAGIDTHSKEDPLARAVFPGVKQLTGVGTKSKGINLETLLSLSPDLVILYAQKDGLSLAKRLDTMGIPSVIILPESMEGIQTSLEIIARVTGTSHRAKQTLSAMDTLLEMVRLRTCDIPLAEKKRAYFASSQGLFKTAAGNMLQDTILSRAGMINVSHHLNGYFQDISPEQLVAWNPQVIFISRNLKPMGLTALYTPAMKKVNAVAQHHIYRFPSSLAPWDFPSPLSALATLWAACQAYPQRFRDIDLAAEADRFHRQVFGLTLTDMGGTFNDTVARTPMP